MYNIKLLMGKGVWLSTLSPEMYSASNRKCVSRTRKGYAVGQGVQKLLQLQKWLLRDCCTTSKSLKQLLSFDLD